MRKLPAPILCALIFPLALSAQPSAKLLYKDLVFENVTVSRNISYGSHDDAVTEKKYHLLDLYEAKDDTAKLRPLIIWMHGGGFKYGKKTSNGIPLWSKTFAQRGYICAAINYRLSKKKPLRKFPDLVEGCMDAIRDVNDVVAFFKENSSQYRVDTNRIILAGNSAGAMIAIQAVYSSPYEMGQLVNQKNFDTLSRKHNPMKISAIVSFWGAVYDSSWLQNARTPIAIVFGSKDKIVPPGNKGPMSGGQAIYGYASAIGIPVAIKVYNGYGHELQKSFNPFWAGRGTKKRWLDAGQFAGGFLYEQLSR